jgi:hypothetical protein
MRKVLLLLIVLSVLYTSCAWLFPPQKVECCEKTAACCHEQMCCLPRYAKAAGREPKSFTTETPVYGTAQDLEPQPGETITKPGLLSRWNPFGSSEDGQSKADDAEKAAEKPEEEKEDEGFFGRLLPF